MALQEYGTVTVALNPTTGKPVGAFAGLSLEDVPVATTFDEMMAEVGALGWDLRTSNSFDLGGRTPYLVFTFVRPVLVT